MPNWKTHLEIAQNINIDKKYKTNLFYIGNILPDINAGFLIKTNNKVSREITHLDKEKFKEINDITDPVKLGYYVHLSVDKVFNEYFYKIHSFSEETKIQKHQDLFKYDTKFTHNITFQKDDIHKINEIKQIKISEFELLNAIDYLNTNFATDKPYNVYSEEELNDLVAICIDKLTEELNNLLP